jgi:outer membrane protein OmpA-like peptidoglycan-associated protein
MVVKFRIAFFVVLLSIPFITFCQSTERIARNANAYFEDGEFELALPLFLKVKDNFPAEVLSPDDLAFRIAICYYNQADKRDSSIVWFEDYCSKTKVDSNYQAHYLLGQLYQEHYRFDEALSQFEAFRKFVDKDSVSDKQTLAVVREILDKRTENCNYGKLVYQSPRKVIIENLGEPVNTKYSEYAPVISPDESRIVFTRRTPEGVVKKLSPDGDYYEDIFIAEIEDGAVMRKLSDDSLRAGFLNVLKEIKVSQPVALNKINSASYDAAVQFSSAADKLYVYRKNNVWVSSKDNNGWGSPQLINELEHVLNKFAYEPSVSISLDGQQLFFSSDRFGGYGGLDLYRSVKQSDGTWSAPENLGSAVNTKEDEDSPYIDPDNKTLYFSSKGHSSMGGFDVFKTFMEHEKFLEVSNMGYPVNSPGDDIFFMMTPKYNRGYYASNRSGGKGKMDIYRLTFADERKTFAEVKGLVLKGDKLVPARSKITLIDAETNKEFISVKSDSLNGTYLLLAPHNKKYNMLVSTEGFVPYKKQIDIPEQVNYFQYYQEVHHVHLKDKAGNIIGQVITVYTSNGDSITTEADSIFNVTGDKDPFVYELLAYLNNDSLASYFARHSDSKAKYDASKDKDQFLYQMLASLSDDQLLSMFGWNKELVLKYRKRTRHGYNASSDVKFYITRDSLLTLMKEDPQLRFSFPKNTTISFIDIRKVKGANSKLDPDVYLVSDQGIEELIKESREVTDQLLNKVFVKEKESTVIPKVLVLFEFRKNELSEEAKSQLKVFADFLKAHPDLEFQVVGHTDSVGTQSYNRMLSLRRAMIVGKFLLSQGVPKKVFSVTGKGSEEPLASNTKPDGSDDEEGRRLNRRVEFILVKKK